MLDLRHLSLLYLVKGGSTVDKDHPIIKNNLYELNQKKNNLIETIVKIQIDNERLEAREYETHTFYATYERFTDIAVDISRILFDLWTPADIQEVEWYEYFCTLYNFTVGSLTDDLCTNFHILVHSCNFYKVVDPPTVELVSTYRSELEGLFGIMKVEHELVKSELGEIQQTFKDRHNRRIELSKKKFINTQKIKSIENELTDINNILDKLCV